MKTLTLTTKQLHLGNLILVSNSLNHYIAVSVLSLLFALLLSFAKRIFHQFIKLNDLGNMYICGRLHTLDKPYIANRARIEKHGRILKDRAWIELSRTALKQNVRFLQAKLPDGATLMPAVKADAYGHGAVPISRELNRLGIKHFCVACVKEGITLRHAGIKGEILVLGYTHPDAFPLLAKYKLTQTVVDYDYAQKLADYGKRLHVHIGIDTGMHRLGTRSENINDIINIFDMQNLQIDGIFTHLSVSDSLLPKAKVFTKTQAECFYEVIDKIKNDGYKVPKVHLQASYGLLNYPELGGDYARVGIAIYGVLSTKEDTEKYADALVPVLSLKARVASVRTLQKNESAGYGMAFTATHDTKIAALTIGYADGLPRGLSNSVGSVLINGYEAKIVGRICMDQTLVDVTHIPYIESGDIATIIGTSGNLTISAADIANKTDSITNEFLSRLGKRLERFWK